MKCMVYGEIQTILPCIFGKFKFQTNSLTMLENDGEIHNFTLIYFPVLLYPVDFPIHLFELFTCSYRVLSSFYFDLSLEPNHFYFGVQIAKILSRWGTLSLDLSSIPVGMISGLKSILLLV